jgi:RIO kinase 1
MSQNTDESAALVSTYLVGAPRVVKSGKEATVYCCQRHPSQGGGLIVMKVYEALKSREFKDDAVYQEGRVIRDARLRRAYSHKTRAGRGIQFDLWVSHEYETMKTLHAAGADIPRPLAHAGGPVIYMEYVGDETSAAPTLNAVSLSRNEAPAFYTAVMRNVALFLASDCVHADLSAFNVLYWRGRIKIIDFPQAVDPRFNRNALTLLTRDITNVCAYFARYGLRDDANQIARGLWTRWLNGTL